MVQDITEKIKGNLPTLVENFQETRSSDVFELAGTEKETAVHNCYKSS